MCVGSYKALTSYYVCAERKESKEHGKMRDLGVRSDLGSSSGYASSVLRWAGSLSHSAM